MVQKSGFQTLSSYNLRDEHYNSIYTKLDSKDFGESSYSNILDILSAHPERKNEGLKMLDRMLKEKINSQGLESRINNMKRTLSEGN